MEMLIDELHKALSAVCPINGVSELSSGNYRIDFHTSATTAQRTAAQTLLVTYQPVPDDAWGKLQAAFLVPGNALYEGVLKKSLNAFTLTTGYSYHHFMQLQLCITVIALRRVDGLAFAINQLNTTLGKSVANALSSSEKTQWNTLMDQCGFPNSCKIS